MNRTALGSSLAVAVTLSSCGGGAAALFGASGGGGDTNSASALTGFAVLEPRQSESCRLRFVLSDAESNPADVELFYQLADGVPRAITQVPSVQLTELETASQGLPHTLAWNFAAEPDLPDDARFVGGVTVFARLAGAPNAVDVQTNAAVVGLGNDAPLIEVEAPSAPEQTGIVAQRLTLADSASDLASVRVEYDDLDDDPDLGWQLARPGGIEGVATPDPAIAGTETNPAGIELVFFWDTRADLGDVDRDVRLRFTASDAWDTAEPQVTAAFRIDNNSPPIATIGEGALLLNPDGARGIPIPFEVLDAEGDEVRVVFQWRAPNESFPELPETRSELEAILADPDERRERRICTSYRAWVGGRAVFLDATHLRLPDLAGRAAALVARGIAGREIELVRPANRFVDVTEGWASNPLQQPVAALPTDGGVAALVLDVPGPGSWRLREVELATGAVLRSLGSSTAGRPTAMALERDGRGVLVASETAGHWNLERVPLDGAPVQALYAFDDSVDEGSVRGLAALGSKAALVTVGDSLVRVDWGTPLEPASATLMDQLAEPWGIALDPAIEGRVYLAERAAILPDGVGRVRSIDLDLRDGRRVVSDEAAWSTSGLPRPGAIAVERNGIRLLAACEVPGAGSGAELRAVELGEELGGEAYTLAEGTSPGGAIAVGADDARVLVDVHSGRIYVAGGILARRQVASFDPATAVVAFSAPLANVPEPDVTWRAADQESVLQPGPAGRSGRFVWDARDAGDELAVFLRQLAYDSQRGIDSQSCCSRPVTPLLERTWTVSQGAGPADALSADADGDGDLDLVVANAPEYRVHVLSQTHPDGGAFGVTESLGGGFGTFEPLSVAAGDVDGDGDLDLACAYGTSDTLGVWIRTASGYGTTPLLVGGSDRMNRPESVVLADLDGDGDLDLACANSEGHDLTIFLQTSPGQFARTPIVLGNLLLTRGPVSLAAADFDGDGDLDLASANSVGDTLTVFRQTSPGAFDPAPIVLGGPSVAMRPVSIVWADLDADGDLDLAAANESSDNLTVFSQVSPGTFDPVPLVLGGPGLTDEPLQILALDLEGDGDMDLASLNRNEDFEGGFVTIFRQTTAGAFDPDPFVVEDLLPSGTAMTAMDLESDGDLDIFYARPFQGHIIEQTSPADWDPSLLGVTGSPRSVAPADLDGDGDLDIAYANTAGDELGVFFQGTPGNFESFPIVVGGPGRTDGPASIAAADLNGDGALDLASANGAGNDLTVFFQVSAGVFDLEPLVLGGAGSTEGPSSILAADLDGDLDLDLACANAGGSNLTVFTQSSPGVFDAAPLVLGAPGLTDAPSSIVAADLDGDGDLDLACANREGDDLTVFLQSAPGVFHPDPLVLGGPGTTDEPRAILAFDMDGDGDLDLASANSESRDLTLFLQTSPGTFEAEPIVIETTGSDFYYPTSISAGDLDGDGDVDLVSGDVRDIGGSFSGNIRTYHQQSPGVFYFRPALSLPGTLFTALSVSCTTADLDGDGDLDLVSANGDLGDLIVGWGGR